MRAAYILVAVAAIAVIAACAAIFLLPGHVVPAEDSGSYFEIVREGKSAAGTVFEEYLVMESGLLMQKRVVQGTGELAVSLRRVDAEEARAAIAQTASAFPFFGANDAIAPEMPGAVAPCADCVSYNVMRHAPNTSRQWKGTGEAFNRTFESTEALFLHGALEETRYVQAVYGSGTKTIDLHAFADGTIVYEEFEGDNNLVAARVTYGPPSLLASLDAAIAGAAPNTSRCGLKGMPFSYLEAFANGRHATIPTCGDGDTPADRLFNSIIGGASP